MFRNDIPGVGLSRDMTILSSMCDRNSVLSIPAAFDMFQDTAAFHAEIHGIGTVELERRNYFWIISKVRLHINRMPSVLDEVVSSTWIQPADHVSCERDYSITSGDELLAYGKSIWAVIDKTTEKLVHMDEIYPVVTFDVPSPDDRNFARIRRKFEDAEEIGSYTVRSVDIDLAGHMNNVNYVRAMLGCFTSEQIEAMGITEVEVNFIVQSYEGETLTFCKRQMDDGSLEIGAIKEDGRAAFLAKII